MASLVGKSGAVHAFEPNPEMVELLNRAKTKNNLSNVIIHPIGLGSEEGELKLTIPAGHSGMASFIRKRDTDAIQISVEVKALSAILESLNIGPIRLVKIDVEGF